MKSKQEIVSYTPSSASAASCSSRPGLQTSGKELQGLLEKSGRRERMEGVEKLDLLMWLADQVRGSVEDGRRMKLRIDELAVLLQREGLAEAGEKHDAKSVVTGLLALRLREMKRLDYASDKANQCAEADHCFALVLADMSAQRVSSCFETAVVPFTDKPEGRADKPSSKVSDGVQRSNSFPEAKAPSTDEGPLITQSERAPNAGDDKRRSWRSRMCVVM